MAILNGQAWRERVDQVRQLDDALVKRETLLSERAGSLANIEELVRERCAALVEREGVIADLEGRVREREAALADREALILDRDRELAGINQAVATAAAASAAVRRIIPLGRDTVLVRLDFGGHIVLPTWNVDVVVGLVREGVIEPWTQSAVRALLKPGQTFINVGVNFGYYLVLGAHCVERTGRVIGIEANRRLFPYLMRTVNWTGFPDTIRLFNCAASDVDGLTLDIRFDPQTIGGMSVVEAFAHPDVANRDHSWSTMIEGDRIEDALWEKADLGVMFDQNGEWKKGYGLLLQERCETRRLDTLLPSAAGVHLMLMDIEGSEPRAILGGRDLIQRSPELNIIMEWGPFYALKPENVAYTDAMYEFLAGLGYGFFRIRHEDFKAGQELPSLTRLLDKEALYRTGHGDVLISKDPDASVAGWSGRFVDPA